MKYYLAPMYGITGHIYRNAYEKVFSDIDKYFSPFIVPNRGKKFKGKDLQDVLPENNDTLNLIPQILSNESKGFIITARKLQNLGYDEINLNLGCPSRMVSSKNRGSAFLAMREELDRFLDEIYTIDDMKISIKTRLGKNDPEEFYELIKIFNKYPLEELIIHPRTQKDFYGNTPNLEMFNHAIEESKNSICYNGDIFTPEDKEDLLKRFPSVDKIMLGRGVLANPGLLSEIKSGRNIRKDTFVQFHEELLNSYDANATEDMHVLIRMKELWGYMCYIFSNNKENLKKIKQTQTVEEYRIVTDKFFKEEDIIPGSGLFTHGNWGIQ